MGTVILTASHSNAIDRAVDILRRGGLVAFPTDTVYGVGALLSHPRAIARLYVIKGRDNAKAIPILLGDPPQMDQVAVDISSMARRLAGRFWPGPLTLVVPKRPSLPEQVSSGSTVGVRMPDHPVTLALMRQTGPLAVTSANRSGAASSISAQEVLEQLGGSIPLILDGGQAPGGSSSTVVDCTGPEPKILRPGPISLDEILEALN